MHAMSEDGPHRSPRGVSASPEPAGTSSSGSGGQQARDAAFNIFFRMVYFEHQQWLSL